MDCQVSVDEHEHGSLESAVWFIETNKKFMHDSANSKTWS
jgi:hypothetical protein